MTPSKYTRIRSLFLAAGILLAFHYTSRAEAATPPDSAYTLKGKIEGLGDGWIWLYHEGAEGDKLDSTQVRGGSFVFKGYAADPHYCMLAIPDPTRGKQYPFGFFLQGGELTLTGKKDSLRKAVVTGSPVQDEYQQFLAGQKDIDAVDEQLSAIYKNARMKNDRRQMDSVERSSEQLDIRRRQYVRQYTAAHPASYVTAFAIYMNFGFNPDATALGDLYKSLDPSIQATFFGKKLRAALGAAELTDIGKPAPAFVQNDVNGKPVSLASFKGQYVLVDFWASWCGPCRAENPNVVKAYRAFHPRGFAILGISLDENKDKWVAAIKKDQLDWTQVSDLKGWQNTVADLYGVKGIPMNFLLDKDGKIIAKSLRGEELEKKLAELVK